MNDKHSPGPWEVRCDYGALSVEICATNAVATVWTKQLAAEPGHKAEVRAWPEGEANARLVAAAPELLEALRQLAFAIDPSETGEVEAFFKSPLAMARAAIAEATGAA